MYDDEIDYRGYKKIIYRIREHIRKYSNHFAAAGRHIDTRFSERDVAQRWTKLRSEPGAVPERDPLSFDRFELATNRYLAKPPNYLNMDEVDRLLHARTILLLTWIVTDPDADRLSPALTDLQNWSWVTKYPEGGQQAEQPPEKSYHRQLARAMLIGFKGDQWLLLVKDAWREHKVGLGKSKQTSAATPTDPRSSKSKTVTKWEAVMKRLEDLVRQNPDTPFTHSALGREFKCDRKVIKKAIKNSSKLSAHFAKLDASAKLRKESMPPGVIESTPQSTEQDPVSAAIEQEAELKRLSDEQAAELAREERQHAARRKAKGSSR